ncbi:unnamed protein product (macronuclear) [Paramecium tetraurelia]|uniref:Uncharacterized protein n=1 Tax=Paramecium tetraurelia TaxID=5888 RepID=A0E3C7_PARTE|nr:uncharacterized protein GSPATT00022967001 [Paramecium tetraurelia]CAK89794.1 unnamed protein product [Paramecium tetraurelia]|eukprot:XP_001457191.1 hypothetical protein (macronuclear) [Paramecium tetraurelia strain d4-2]
MSSEINIRQLLYFKSQDSSINNIQIGTPFQTQRVVKTTLHVLNRFRSTGLSDFRLTTIHTQTPIVNNFRYGFKVDEFQNGNSQTHFLEVYDHPTKYVNSYIAESRKNIAQLRDQANQIRLEISSIHSRYQQELKNIETHFRDNLKKKYRQIKEDNVLFTEEQYRLSKEYLILMKAKMNMENEQIQLTNRVVQLEKTLQGVSLELQS